MTMQRNWLTTFAALVTSLSTLLLPSEARGEVSEINTAPTNQCPVFSGRPGIAFTVDAARKLRDAAEILLPGCQKERSLLDDQLKVRLLRVTTLTEINDDLVSALTARKEEVKELRSIKTTSSTSAAFWLALGFGLGVGAAVGIGYALVGAR